MRLIGSLDSEEQAKTLEDYLLTLGISGKVLHGSNGWELWVHDEDQRAQAAETFEQFRRDPSDPKYEIATARARKLRRQAERDEKQRSKNFIDLRQRWAHRSGARPLTLILIATSILVAVGTRLNSGQEVAPLRNLLSINSLYDERSLTSLLLEEYGDKPIDTSEARRFLFLHDVRQGEVWRLVTPIFLHFGILHLLFNMFWLHALGSMIETRKGTRVLLLVVLASAVISNVGQYAYSGPYFGGMSGVVYALFGYVWMQSRYAPGSGLFLQPNTVVFMMLWFFLCMTGFVGPIANVAHAGGLVVGTALGIAPYAWRKLIRS